MQNETKSRRTSKKPTPARAGAHNADQFQIDLAQHGPFLREVQHPTTQNARRDQTNNVLISHMFMKMWRP